MKIEFDPGLIEEVLFREIRTRGDLGDTKLSEEYHAIADPIYEDFPLEDRQREFRKIEWNFFSKLGFASLVDKAFNEFPELEEAVAGGIIIKAKNKHDEGSNLVIGLEDKTRKKRIKIKLLSERFHNTDYLQKFLRHELMHVLDMLNEAFGYKDETLGGNPMEQSIITERYSTFWDIFVDSRLLRMGKETIGSKESRCEEFFALYMGFPEVANKVIFEKLWDDETLTHSRIMDLATDVHKVLEIAHDGTSENREKRKKVLLPGSLCPLCQFRTYRWVENLEEDVEVVQDIRHDFPDWLPEDGACGRCVEMYKSRRAISHGSV